MKNYTIYCTGEQTRKALELGAPVELESEYYNPTENDFMLDDPIPCKSFTNGYHYAKCPTAEQMLGFFRSKNIHVVIHKDVVDDWSAYGHEIAPIEFTVFERLTGYKSYEEAIIAAINAALEYLVKHNLTKYDEYTKTST